VRPDGETLEAAGLGIAPNTATFGLLEGRPRAAAGHEPVDVAAVSGAQMDPLVIGAPVCDARSGPLERLPLRGRTVEMQCAGDAAHGQLLVGRARRLGGAQLVDHAGQPLVERDLRLEPK
jgi:hypothetical protein